MSNEISVDDRAQYAGFYGNDTETFYLTPAGRLWLVQSEDELPTVREVSSIPSDVIPVDDMVTPDEADGWCRQIQDASGETLLSS